MFPILLRSEVTRTTSSCAAVPCIDLEIFSTIRGDLELSFAVMILNSRRCVVVHSNRRVWLRQGLLAVLSIGLRSCCQEFKTFKP